MSVEAGPISVQVISPMPVMVEPGNLGLGNNSPGTPLFGNELIRVSELPAEFMPGGKYSLENMPLANSIPLDRFPDSGKKTTAAHELQHAIVGQLKGNSVVALSVNPEGSRLGWTLFSGEVDPATAAAGSIETVFGPAEGFGGDLATIMLLDLKQGKDPGSSIFWAQNEAQSIISGFDRDFLAIASEIIALKGFLTAEDFNQVLSRAEFELAWRNSGFDLKEVLELQGIKLPQEYKNDTAISSELEIPDFGTYTLIETYKDKIVSTTFVDGKIKTQTVVCPACGVEGGGHLPSCDAVIGKTSMPIPVFESPISTPIIQSGDFSLESGLPHDFPQHAVIYTG